MFAKSKEGVFEKKAWLEEYLWGCHKHANIEQCGVNFVILESRYTSSSISSFTVKE